MLFKKDKKYEIIHCRIDAGLKLKLSSLTNVPNVVVNGSLGIIKGDDLEVKLSQKNYASDYVVPC